MKKIFIILILFTGLFSCENMENDFPDFNYTTGYFPYQYPVRTLVLGNDVFDNSNDNNHKFLISATMGGVYSNKEERLLNIELAPTLCNKILFAAGSTDTIRLMPQAYYTLSSSQKLVIPKGEITGNIEVQLTDAFFIDPLAIKRAYVIPVRIVSATNLDTVLRGKSSKSNPDPRITAQWDIVPKDFTMFAVKYINPYHGNYLHRGTSTVKDASAAVLESTTYRKTFVEQDEIWSLVTASMNKVLVSGSIRSTKITGALNMILTFASNGDITITQNTGSAFSITGTGKFVTNGDEWGGKKRDAIRINYQLTNGGITYNATDTLVIRDRGVKMEVYNPSVY
jgi:hypothetical protein